MYILMKRFLKIFFLLGFITSIFLGSCTTSKRGCGCPSKKGMVGY